MLAKLNNAEQVAYESEESELSAAGERLGGMLIGYHEVP